MILVVQIYQHVQLIQQNVLLKVHANHIHQHIVTQQKEQMGDVFMIQLLVYVELLYVQNYNQIVPQLLNV